MSTTTMKKSMNWTKTAAILMGAALLLAGDVSMLPGQASHDFLNGNVIALDQAAPSLAKKMERAREAFSRDKTGAYHFTGYSFLCRHRLHYGGKESSLVPYRVGVNKDRIKVRRRTAPEKGVHHSIEDEEGSRPAALLLLHKKSGRGSTIVDAHLLDVDQAYLFETDSVYWLGSIDTGESMDFLKDRFAEADEDMQEDLVFLIGAHADSRVPAWLKQTALGGYPSEVREQAVFWRGNLDDENCLSDLKEIYRRVREDEMREKVIFSLSICKDPEAVEEIIRIAKTEDSEEVRKQAIFWLGQKASEAAVETLKEVVNTSQENTEIKESAVFALSQLPNDRSVPLLMDIARTNQNPEIRKNAIFWLGESGDSRAISFFEEILSK